MDLPSRGGRAPGSQANGSFPKGTGRLSEKSPAGYPPPHHRDDTPGSAGVPPACCPFGCRSVSLRCCSRPPCRREPHGPGRSRGRAPLPVDSGGGDGRSCERICAGGTPALPGSLHPMTSSHQGHKFAEAFWCRLSLKEVYLSLCLFVFIHGSSSRTTGRFSPNDPHGSAGAGSRSGIGSPATRRQGRERNGFQQKAGGLGGRLPIHVDPLVGGSHGSIIDAPDKILQRTHQLPPPGGRG